MKFKVKYYKAEVNDQENVNLNFRLLKALNHFSGAPLFFQILKQASHKKLLKTHYLQKKGLIVGKNNLKKVLKVKVKIVQYNKIK